MGNSPTNDSYPRWSSAPSTSMPLIGFGRSHTITGTPCLPHARRQLAIV
jgi:hypothetical protein